MLHLKLKRKRCHTNVPTYNGFERWPVGKSLLLLQGTSGKAPVPAPGTAGAEQGNLTAAWMPHACTGPACGVRPAFPVPRGAGEQ